MSIKLKLQSKEIGKLFSSIKSKNFSTKLYFKILESLKWARDSNPSDTELEDKAQSIAESI